MPSRAAVIQWLALALLGMTAGCQAPRTPFDAPRGPDVFRMDVVGDSVLVGPATFSVRLDTWLRRVSVRSSSIDLITTDRRTGEATVVTKRRTRTGRVIWPTIVVDTELGPFTLEPGMIVGLERIRPPGERVSLLEGAFREKWWRRARIGDDGVITVRSPDSSALYLGKLPTCFELEFEVRLSKRARVTTSVEYDRKSNVVRLGRQEFGGAGWVSVRYVVDGGIKGYVNGHEVKLRRYPQTRYRVREETIRLVSDGGESEFRNIRVRKLRCTKDGQL